MLRDEDFTEEEQRVASWLYQRIAIERKTWVNHVQPKWADVPPGTIRTSYLLEARELVCVVAGTGPRGNKPWAVWNV